MPSVEATLAVSHLRNYFLIGHNEKLCSNKGEASYISSLFVNSDIPTLPVLKRKACLQFVRPKGLTCNGERLL